MKDKTNRKKEINSSNTWLKRFKLFFAVFLLFLIPVTFAFADDITPHKDDSGSPWNRSLNTAGNDQLIGLTYNLRTLLWTSGVILESAQSILTRVSDVSFYQSQLGGFKNKQQVAMGWDFIKNLCNATIIILLLFIAFGTILQVERYNYKYLLVKLIVAALLINFSGVIVGIILDFTHLIMAIFSSKLAGIGTKIQNASNIISEYTNNSDLGNIDTVKRNLTDNITHTISRVNVNMILAAILMFILGITVLAVSVFLIVRTVSLWLLFTLAPLAFALSVLPHTRGASLKWWDAFLRNAFAGPLIFFFLYLTVIITENLNIASGTAVGGSDKFIMFSSSGRLLDYLFLIVLLWASIFLSRSLSITGAVQVVGYFRDLTRGDRGMNVVSKIIDRGGAALDNTKAGKMLHQWTGSPIQIKENLKGPFAGGAGTIEEGVKKGIRAFQPIMKTQTEATRKALESMLNPVAIGRVMSIVDAKREGKPLDQLGGDLRSISQVAAMSGQDPGEFVRTLWKRFQPNVRPTGSFWKDARVLNETINKQVAEQESVRRTFNEIGMKNDKLLNFQAKDANEKEAQLYKMAWTGALPDFFNTKLGKTYSPENLADHIKSTFGEARAPQVAEKLKMISEVKKDPSMAVASFNTKTDKVEIDTKSPVQQMATNSSAVIKPEDLKKMAPQALVNKDEKGNFTSFNEVGKQFLLNMSKDYMKEVQNMREDTVKAISQAYNASQKDLAKEFAKQLNKGGKLGGVQADTIKAINKAQMQGAFHVEQVQAPHSQISLGQEFLNKIAGRAFASKRVDTGGMKIVSGDQKEKEKVTEEVKTVEQETEEQQKIAGRAFASKQVKAEGAKKTEEEVEKEEDTGSLKDKQKFLLFGEKTATDEA